MRYLNKIVFINSGDKSIKFAEVNLDGNVHLIGTQGVGKSTLLRAILFFYNADKLKLGIAREKKTFDEYYFPYQNSYIIYEVKSETGLFCVLAFKAQGRVAFRFFDSGFDRTFFIDHEGRAFESWDKTRDAFGKNIYYTRIIHSYEEYRNILYGNNKGLSSEFRKYAILESRQYQNIPRTITNVFLNANLSADFVKETIIKSLNEEDIKIDLSTYSQSHLKDFETNLADIQKWTERNKIGENPVEKQADQISVIYAALKYLDRRKMELGSQLGWALNHVREQEPRVRAEYEQAEQSKIKVAARLAELDGVFEKKKEKAQEQIGFFKGKLDDLKKKKGEYATFKIDAIIERSSQKGSLEMHRKNLVEEKDVLSSQFLEISQRYGALLGQLENQWKEFENSKKASINRAREDLFQLLEKINLEYELLYDEIRLMHKSRLDVANNLVREKTDAITHQKITLSEYRSKRFYETEIELGRSEIIRLTASNSRAEEDIQRASERIKAIQREWELEGSEIKAQHHRNVEKENDLLGIMNEEISAIDSKIANSRGSLYGWLNEQVPGWEKTIGKVIDEENVLFKSGLSPRKLTHGALEFYGISIDIQEIDKKVKTVADYEKEKVGLEQRIQSGRRKVSELNAGLNTDLEGLKRRFQPKIKAQKEIIQHNEYAREQGILKLEETQVRLSEFRSRAEKEKAAAIGRIEADMERLSEEELKAKDEVKKVDLGIHKSMEVKKREKAAKLAKEQLKMDEIIRKTETEIQDNKEGIEKKVAEIREKQKRELDDKGANTERLDTIEQELLTIHAELAYIESNNSLVERYKYDKEELFDKEEEFKSKKALLERQLESDLSRHKQQQEKLFADIGRMNALIDNIGLRLKDFEADLAAYESFIKTEACQSVEKYVAEYGDAHRTELKCISLMDELNQNHYSLKDRFTELQEAVNKFTGNFQENNLFSFKTKFIERAEYLEFAELLKEFIEENKIIEYKKRVEERFAHIIRQIGKETDELISKEGEIHGVISDINKDFISRKFVQAIKSMELRTVPSANRIFQLLVEIKKFNDENSFSLGSPNLFSEEGHESKNERAISLLKQLIKGMATYKEREITLSDSFELQFRIVENDNDTDWVEKLTNVGSDGTDILIKAMINIMLLNVFKERAAKKQKDDFRLHCMMDEIGKLHPNNVKGILKFANDRNILLINSSPTSYNATDYRYTYLLVKDSKNVTSVKRLVKKMANLESEIPNN